MSVAASGEDAAAATSSSSVPPDRHHLHTNQPFLLKSLPFGDVRGLSYLFHASSGLCSKIPFDLSAGMQLSSDDFSWHHVELPNGFQSHQLLADVHALIDVLCPPLTLQEILALVSNGPYCGSLSHDTLLFRINSPGPVASSNSPLRLAARVSEKSLITVSVGRVPRLGAWEKEDSLFSTVPTRNKDGSFAIMEQMLEFMLTLNHSEHTNNPVPRRVSNLLVHVLDTYVDHVHDIVTKVEMEVDSVELELDKGGHTLKKQMLEDRRFPKMHLELQRLLQVVSHGEQVFPRVKEKFTNKSWFAGEDIVALEELIGRLRRLKENLGFITNRVAALQTGLDSWQSEQINKKLYYLSFLSIIFLPLSIVTGIFGMNVGGVPWTVQKSPEVKDGFVNVMLLCAAILLLLLLCFMFPYMLACFKKWRSRPKLRRSPSIAKRPFLRRNLLNSSPRGEYVRV